MQYEEQSVVDETIEAIMANRFTGTLKSSIHLFSDFKRLGILPQHIGNGVYGNRFTHPGHRTAILSFEMHDPEENLKVVLDEAALRERFSLGLVVMGGKGHERLEEAAILEEAQRLVDEDRSEILFHAKTATLVDAGEDTHPLLLDIYDHLDENRIDVSEKTIEILGTKTAEDLADLLQRLKDEPGRTHFSLEPAERLVPQRL